MRIDKPQIRLWYDTMIAGRLVEIRMLSSGGPTFSGIFEDADSIINALQQFPDYDYIKGVYYTLNPLNDYCRDWPQYGRIIQAERTASDGDIARREWLLIDIDPKRPSGVSATDEEKDKARTVADAILKLYDIEIPSIDYFPNPKIIMDSGNGYHLLWRCDMENTQESTRTVRDFLQTLNTEFGTADADVDTSVHNASRISKLPGTWARKGPDSQDRPHRMSKVIQVVPDDRCDTLVIDDLKAVIDHFAPVVKNAPETFQDAVDEPLNEDSAKIMRDVESCLSQLEIKGVRIPADRDRWHTILAGWYHTLGADGLASFLRFSALWENNNPQEDRAKYLEMARYPHHDRPATIESFFRLCRKYGVTPSSEKSRWRETIFDPTVEVIQPDPLVNCGGVMVVSRENLTVITGKPKACKTTFQSGMIASCLTGRAVLNMDAPKPLKVLLADTEQSRFHLARQCDRVFRLAGLDKENREDFTVLNLRPFSPSERYSYIVEAVSEVRPDILFIDGATDLITDTNDLEQSEALVANLLTLSSQFNIGICTIVHTNPREDKIRGHIGSTLERKCESAILLEREGMENEIKVRPKEVRNKPFETFIFHLTDNGDPELTAPREGPHTAGDWLIYLMEPRKEYRNCELVEMLSQKGFGKSTVQNALNKALQRDHIQKVGDKYTVALSGEEGRSMPPLYT